MKKNNFIKLLLLIIFYFSTFLSFSNIKHVIGCRPVGFFSCLFQVINHLAGCEEQRKTPVVFWNSTCLYYNPNGHNGSYNVWEYYFEPVAHLKYNNGDKIHEGYFGESKFYIPWTNIQECFNKKILLQINTFIIKYIRIKSNIQDKINTYYKENMSNKINIGIHLRGTDKAEEVPKTDTNIILNHANKIANDIGENCQFFVATDDEVLLDLAKKVLNRKVVFYDSYRSKNGKPIHRNINKALLGEQMLIEAKILSMCSYFLHTLSNVAIGVCAFYPHIQNIAFDHHGNIINT